MYFINVIDENGYFWDRFNYYFIEEYNDLIRKNEVLKDSLKIYVNIFYINIKKLLIIILKKLICIIEKSNNNEK